MMYNSNSMFSMWIWLAIILFVIAIFVASDANKRGHNGILWGFLVMIMPMMGIFFYLIFVSLNPVAGVTTYTRQNVNATQTTPPRYQPPQPSVDYGGNVKPADVNQQIPGNFCVHCGSNNIENADYCNKCGTKIPNEY